MNIKIIEYGWRSKDIGSCITFKKMKIVFNKNYIFKFEIFDIINFKNILLKKYIINKTKFNSMINNHFKNMFNKFLVGNSEFKTIYNNRDLKIETNKNGIKINNNLYYLLNKNKYIPNFNEYIDTLFWVWHLEQ